MGLTNAKDFKVESVKLNWNFQSGKKGGGGVGVGIQSKNLLWEGYGNFLEQLLVLVRNYSFFEMENYVPYKNLCPSS